MPIQRNLIPTARILGHPYQATLILKKDMELSVLYAKLPQSSSLSWIRKNEDTLIDFSHVIKGIVHTGKQHFRVEERKY